MPFIGGHDKSNDNLLAEAEDKRRENDFGIPSPFQERGRAGAWAGRDYDAVDGYYMPGTSGADRDVERYRALGEQRQAPVQIDGRQESYSRGLQMGALGLLRNAAYGGAPSQAAFQGQMASQDALRQGMMGSGGGSLAGMRAAMGQTGGRMSAAGAAAMDARSREAMRDMGAFSGAASGVRGQDLTLATSNAQLEAQQRAIDEQRQQAYERMGWDTRNADMQGRNEEQGRDEMNAIRHRQQREAEKQADFETIRDVGSLGLGVLFSDERAKRNVLPMGSLSHLMRR